MLHKKHNKILIFILSRANAIMIGSLHDHYQGVPYKMIISSCIATNSSIARYNYGNGETGERIIIG